MISPDGKTVTPIKPKVAGKLPDSKATLKYIDSALAGVVTEGTADWKFGDWPQNKIPLHAKTGTAEVAGKQTTSWFDTYTKDYTIVMTISQGGTGSGGSGTAVRQIYEAMYGIQKDGTKIDSKKGSCPSRVTRAAEDLRRRRRSSTCPPHRAVSASFAEPGRPRAPPAAARPPWPRSPRPAPRSCCTAGSTREDVRVMSVQSYSDPAVHPGAVHAGQARSPGTPWSAGWTG